MTDHERQPDPPHDDDLTSGTLRIPSERRPAVTVDSATQVKTKGRRPAPSELPASAPPASASFEERFRSGPLLGRGGMGEVHQATDLGLMRSVAVKTWRSPDTPEEARQRFLAEARVTAQLEHPNILPIYSLERTSAGAIAFVMRLVEGQTLAEYLAKVCASHAAGYVKPQHRLEERLDHMLKVCDAIDYAHSRGVLHRDLKPENVMLAAHGRVCVMDWGLALVMGERQSESAPHTRPVSTQISGQGARLTTDGDVLGTPEFMAPEQARGRVDSLGPAADQYALGLMLFEVVALAPGRDNGGGMAEVSAAMSGELAPLRHRFGERIPRGLAMIIERATQLRPEDRYPSVRALADDLQRFMRGEAPQVAPDTWPVSLWRRLNRRPAVAMVIFLGVLALALGATTASLYNTLTERQRAAAQAEATSRLTAAVVQRSDGFERQLDEVRLSLQGFAAATEQLLSHGEPASDANWIAAKAIGDEESTAYSVRYGQEINLEHCVYMRPEGTEVADTEAALARLAHVRSEMKRIYRHDGDEQVPLLWVYAAFESGLVINYPGHGVYAADYDPRERPWYRGGRNVRGHHWGRPYRDQSGGTLQLPATLALYDEKEAFIGLVAIDVSLADLAAKLRMSSLPGWRRSYLVDPQGGIVVDTGAAEKPTPAEDDTLRLAQLPMPEVVEAIAEGRTLGTVRYEDSRAVYTRLDVIDWYVVAEIDERAPPAL